MRWGDIVVVWVATGFVAVKHAIYGRPRQEREKRRKGKEKGELIGSFAVLQRADLHGNTDMPTPTPRAMGEGERYHWEHTTSLRAYKPVGLNTTTRKEHISSTRSNY
jgi:hypothetical protein